MLAVVIIVRTLGFQFSVTNFNQFFVKFALAVVRYNTLEKVGRRYAGCASRWKELACGQRIANILEEDRI